MRSRWYHRLKRTAGALVLVAVVGVIAGCGGGDANSSSGSSSDAAASSQRNEPLKVAAVYTVPLEQQWASVVDQAFKDLQKSGDVQYTPSEETSPEDIPRVVRQFGADGYDLVFVESYQAEEEVRAAADEYPKTNFLVGSSLPADDAHPNVGVFGTHVEESAYLCGMLAGGMTKSNKLGFLGGFPIPEVNWLGNAFIQGARDVNPKVSYVVSYLNSWFDPAKTTELAEAQIESGVDVIYAERTPAVDVAAKNDALAVGNITDVGKQFPETVLCSALWDMHPTIKTAVEKTRDGKFAAEDYSQYIKLSADGNRPAEPGASLKIPADVLKRVEERQQAIEAGEFEVKADDSKVRG
jgi:basic membrane lipoprotein Med (substrate-binding protein (PBP1-ABC) superfamily)